MIKVKELIARLQMQNGDDLVVLALDPEGNGFRELAEIETAIFVPDDNEVHLRVLTPSLINQGYSEEDVYTGDNGKDAVVLWPGG